MKPTDEMDRRYIFFQYNTRRPSKWDISLRLQVILLYSRLMSELGQSVMIIN